MAKGLNKELIGKLTEGISTFSKAVDKMVEGTYSIKSFQSSITALDTSLNKLNTLDEFNTKLKSNIENLSKINLKVSTLFLSNKFPLYSTGSILFLYIDKVFLIKK